MIGPVDFDAWDEAALRDAIRKHPLIEDKSRADAPRPFRLACIQLCTYDGTVYMENSLKEIAKTFAETVIIVGVIVPWFHYISALIPFLIPQPVMMLRRAIVTALEKDGKVLTDSEQVGQWCAPTLDVWVVRKDFAEKHPEVVKAFAKSAIDAQQPYIANPDAWLKQPENISKLARLSGVPEGDVPGLVKGNTYLTPQQQTVELTGPVNKAIIDTAQFLKEQGKVPAVANDYSQYVTSRFVQ